MVSFFKVEVEGAAHRAFADVEALAEVMDRLTLLEHRSLDHLEDLFQQDFRSMGWLSDVALHRE